MVNDRNKSPLASKFDGYSPTGANSSFDTFQAKQKGKRRFWIFVFCFAVLVLISIGNFIPKNYFQSQADNFIPTPNDSNIIQSITRDSLSNRNIRIPKDLMEIEEEPQPIHNILTKPSSHRDVDKKHSVNKTGNLSWFQIHSKPVIMHIQWPLFVENSLIQHEPIHRDSTIKIDKPKPFITFSGGTNFATSRLHLKDDFIHYIHTDFEKVYDQTQTSRAGAMFQTNAYLPIPRLKNIWFGTGIGLGGNLLGGEYSFQIDSVPVYDIDNTIAGYVVYPDGSPLKNVELGSAQRTYNYLSIPISISYIIEKSGYRLQSEIGTTFSYLFTASGNSLDAFNVKQLVPLKSILNPTSVSTFGRITLYKKISEFLDIGIGIHHGFQINNMYNLQHVKAINRQSQIQFTTRLNLIQ